jgi:purine-binding chemotaxis protein CheW
MAARIRAETPPSPPAGSRRHVVFWVGEVEYAIEARGVRRILPIPPDPGPEVVVMGQHHPLVDLRVLFRLPPAPGARVVLLVEGAGGRAGLVVDRLAAPAPIDEATLVPLPALFRGIEQRWIGGLARIERRVIVVLVVDAVLGSHAVLPRRAKAAAG